MNKKLLLLALPMLLLGACNQNQQPKGSEPESQGTSQIANHDGKSVATAFTVEEVLEAMKDYTESTVSETDIYVRGKLIGDDKYVDTKHNSYSYYFENHGLASEKPFQMYSGVLASSITTKYNDLTGATIVFHGKAFIFNKNGKTIYEIGYKKDVAPNPTIDLVEGAEEGGSSTESTSTSTSSSQQGGESVPQGAKYLTYDFTTMDSFGEMAKTTDKVKATSGTVTAADNQQFDYKNLTFHPTDNNNPVSYLAFYSKAASAASYFKTKTAVPGKIFNIEITLTENSSKNAKVAVDFGSSPLGDTTSSGQALDQGGLVNTYTAPANSTHFSISVLQGVSSTGKASWYNMNIAKLVVSYVD